MSGFVFHPEANADLVEIWEYIALANLNAADRIMEEIHDKIQDLVAFPRQGHSRPDLTSQPLRFQLVREYLVVYAPEERPLAVIAVLHARRSPRVIAGVLHGRG